MSNYTCYGAAIWQHCSGGIQSGKCGSLGLGHNTSVGIQTSRHSQKHLQYKFCELRQGPLLLISGGMTKIDMTLDRLSGDDPGAGGGEQGK